MPCFRHTLVFVTALTGACGGGAATAPSPAATTPTATPTPPPANVLSVGGTYPTRAQVVADRNTCGNVTAQDNPTIVTHAAGSSAIVLDHAGSAYRGSVDTAGRFTTPAATYPFPDAEYTIAISGRFSTTGFEATVELTRRTGSTTCAYAVGWSGTKQGSPNTIPG